MRLCWLCHLKKPKPFLSKPRSIVKSRLFRQIALCLRPRLLQWIMFRNITWTARVFHTLVTGCIMTSYYTLRDLLHHVALGDALKKKRIENASLSYNLNERSWIIGVWIYRRTYILTKWPALRKLYGRTLPEIYAAFTKLIHFQPGKVWIVFFLNATDFSKRCLCGVIKKQK